MPPKKVKNTIEDESKPKTQRKSKTTENIGDLPESIPKIKKLSKKQMELLNNASNTQLDTKPDLKPDLKPEPKKLTKKQMTQLNEDSKINKPLINNFICSTKDGLDKHDGDTQFKIWKEEWETIVKKITEHNAIVEKLELERDEWTTKISNYMRSKNGLQSENILESTDKIKIGKKNMPVLTHLDDKTNIDSDHSISDDDATPGEPLSTKKKFIPKSKMSQIENDINSDSDDDSD